MSITGIFEQNSRPSSKIYGVITGIVTNNQDPDELGRVKIKIPRISGEDESNWARVISFMAGKDRGAFFLPEVDDEVLVAFECGNISMPYIIGSLWNGEDVTPETNSDGENNIRIIKSRSGHIIRFDDTDGEEKIEIVDKNENNMIIIDTKNEKISIISNKNIEISAPDGIITMEAKDIEITSSASTRIEASSVDLEASGNTNIKGATVNIN